MPSRLVRLAYCPSQDPAIQARIANHFLYQWHQHGLKSILMTASDEQISYNIIDCHSSNSMRCMSVTAGCSGTFQPKVVEPLMNVRRSGSINLPSNMITGEPTLSAIRPFTSHDCLCIHETRGGTSLPEQSQHKPATTIRGLLSPEAPVSACSNTGLITNSGQREQHLHSNKSYPFQMQPQKRLRWGYCYGRGLTRRP